MLRQEKEKIIEELAENLARSTIVITTDFRGLPAKEMVQLRQKLREAGVEYRVAKNTLSRFAAEKAGKKHLEFFGYDDVVKPAQALRDHIRSSGSMLKITGGILGDRLLLAEDIVALASIPSREVLIAQILGQLQAPLQGVYNVLRAPLQGLSNVLQARVRCLEGG